MGGAAGVGTGPFAGALGTGQLYGLGGGGIVVVFALSGCCDCGCEPD